MKEAALFFKMGFRFRRLLPSMASLALTHFKIANLTTFRRDSPEGRLTSPEPRSKEIQAFKNSLISQNPKMLIALPIPQEIMEIRALTALPLIPRSLTHALLQNKKLKEASLIARKEKIESD